MIRSITASRNYKWWVFGTVGISTFLSVVDHGSALVALPDIEHYFDTDLPTVQWVVIGSALAVSALLLPMGRLGDIVGRKNIYITGFAVFIIASAVAGFSPTLEVLIGAKVIQGVGSAMIQANAIAIILSVFPGSERGKSLGSHVSFVGAGAIAGPAVGGFLVSAFSWRAVFLMNLPIGLVAIAATALILRSNQASQQSAEESGAGFDWLGAVLSGLFLLATLLIIGNGHRAGWTSPQVLAGCTSAVLLLAMFVWWELRVQSPMLDLRIFQRKAVSLGVIAGWLSFLGGAAGRFMMPFYLQRVLEYSPRDVGLFMIPPAFCMVIVGPLAGSLSDRYGWRRLTTAGLALSATASFIMATQLTPDSSAALVVGALMLQSIGSGMFNSPNNNAVLSAVERSRYGVVSALTQLVRNSANVTSVALTTTVVVVTMGSLGVEPSLDVVSPAVADAFVAGLHRAFYLLGGLLALGAVICLARGEQTRGTAPGDRPAQAREARPVR